MPARRQSLCRLNVPLRFEFGVLRRGLIVCGSECGLGPFHAEPVPSPVTNGPSMDDQTRLEFEADFLSRAAIFFDSALAAFYARHALAHRTLLRGPCVTCTRRRALSL